MKYCGKCGYFDNHKHKFCPKCGNNLQKKSNKQNTKKTSTQNNYNLRPTINISELELKIHNLTNTERKKRGLILLEFDPEIRNICRQHSKDMSVRNFFAHETPEGKEPADRAAGANFSFEKERNVSGKIGSAIKKLNRYNTSYSPQWAYGENIYQTNLANSFQTVNGVPTHYDWQTSDQIANSVVDGWMKSKDHYENIVMPTWHREGIGAFIANDGKVFVTQNFHYFIILTDNPLPGLSGYIKKPVAKTRNRSVPQVYGNKPITKPRKRSVPQMSKKVTQKPIPSPPAKPTMLAAPVNVSTYGGQRPGKYIEKQFFGAKKSAYVCSPWISKKFVIDMVEMASNGIDIKIITQEVQYNKDTTDFIENQKYDALDQSKLGRAQKHFKYIIISSKSKFVHAKLYIVDRNYAVAGSANFTRSAMTGKNHELITIHNGSKEAKIIEDMFFQIWNDNLTPSSKTNFNS